MASFDVWNPIMNFVTILLLTFSLFLVITGAFTAYFGSGKSRKIGVGLLVGGLIVGVLWGWYTGPGPSPSVDLVGVVVQSIGVIVGAVVGATIAAHTTKPVIGVPVSGKLNLDAVLSVSQMPPGVPVAAVGLDRGENAGILAAEILALANERLADKLKDHREALKKWVVEDSRTLSE